MMDLVYHKYKNPNTGLFTYKTSVDEVRYIIHEKFEDNLLKYFIGKVKFDTLQQAQDFIIKANFGD